jgi:membrane-associated phospholipid phosphatase
VRSNLAAFGWLLLLASPLAAQAPDTLGLPSCGRLACDPDALQRDVDVLMWAYGNPHGSVALGQVDDLSYATFVAIPFGLGIYGAASNGDLRPSVRVAVSQVISTGLVLVLKRSQARPRPFRSGMVLRRGSALDSLVLTRDNGSFPSGHATLAFAAATSLSLSIDLWYVTLPTYAWATTVAWARLRQGVHYPSDVLAGAALGFTTAALVHVLMPDGLGAEVPVFSLRVRL